MRQYLFLVFNAEALKIGTLKVFLKGEVIIMQSVVILIPVVRYCTINLELPFYEQSTTSTFGKVDNAGAMPQCRACYVTSGLQISGNLPTTTGELLSRNGDESSLFFIYHSKVVSDDLKLSNIS